MVSWTKIKRDILDLVQAKQDTLAARLLHHCGHCILKVAGCVLLYRVLPQYRKATSGGSAKRQFVRKVTCKCVEQFKPTTLIQVGAAEVAVEYSTEISTLTSPLYRFEY